MGALDSLIRITFSTLLTKRFTEWDAFKFGLIDKDGNKIKEPQTRIEKKSLNTMTNLVRKVKRTLLKFSPDTPTVNFLLANMLLKEAFTELHEEINNIELHYLNIYLKETNMKSFDEIMNEELNEDKVKVGDTLTTDVKRGEVIFGKTGKITSIDGDMAQVDFGNGNKYGIHVSRIKNKVIVEAKKDNDIVDLPPIYKKSLKPFEADITTAYVDEKTAKTIVYINDTSKQSEIEKAVGKENIESIKKTSDDIQIILK